MELFKESFREVQKMTYQTTKEHGFQELEGNQLYVPTKLALIMSECAEAIEWDRMGKSEELSHELADIVIRTMDLAESLKIDLAQAVIDKATFNKAREYKHGNKKY